LIRLLHAYFPARTLVLGISEACLIALAFIAATVARLGASDATLMLNYEQGFSKILLVAATFIICMYYFDLYDSSILMNRREVLTRVIQVLGTVCILLALLYYLYPPLQLGRGIFLIGLSFVSMILFCWRRFFLMVNSLPQFAERAVIVGEGPLARQLLSEMGSRPELGLRVVARLSESVSQNGMPKGTNGDGSIAELERYIDLHRVNRVIIAMVDRRGKLPVNQLLSMKGRGVFIQDGTELYEAITGKIPIESLHLGWLLFSPGFHVSRALMFYKRILSMFLSGVGLLVSLPLIPFIALAIKLTSPGPVLYRQKRVGQDGSVFSCLKFRTMRADAEADSGPTWASDNDPRITSMGRFLRISRLDEIPQLWNVLKGDMSLVGPRPERPQFVDWLKQEIPYYGLRHTIRPGITGWAQVRYKYGNTVDDAKEKLQYDLFYIKNISLGLDLLIIFKTIKTILWARGAR